MAFVTRIAIPTFGLRVALLAWLTLLFSSMGGRLFGVVMQNQKGWTRQACPSLQNDLAISEKLEKMEINKLLDYCHTGNELMITRNGVFSGSKAQLAEIFVHTCYPMEILTSQGARSMGHCSDFVPYLYFAHARLSPPFEDGVLQRHLNACKNTTSYLHGEYPIRYLFEHARFNYWMPNIEQMNLQQASLVSLTHEFLAKTKIGAMTLQSLVKLVNGTNSDSRQIRVRYMVHSSAEPAWDLVGSAPDYNRFYHGYGHSGGKHSLELVECWASRPDWPTLTVVGHRPLTFFKAFQNTNATRHPRNIRIITEHLPVHKIRFLQATHGVHITPSFREGFGHYINEGRAAHAMIVATNYPPMNEFVKDGVNGVLIDHEAPTHTDWQLVGVQGIFSPNVHISPDLICKAMENVINLPLSIRKAYGQKSRQNFVHDKNAFRRNLEKLNVELLSRRFGNINVLAQAREETAEVATLERTSHSIYLSFQGPTQ